MKTSASAAGTSWNKNMSAIKQVLGEDWVPMPSSHAPLSSISVTPKYNGFVMVTAAGTVSINHTSGTLGNDCLNLNETEGDITGCGPYVGTDSAVRSFVPAGFPSTGTFAYLITLSRSIQ